MRTLIVFLMLGCAAFAESYLVTTNEVMQVLSSDTEPRSHDYFWVMGTNVFPALATNEVTVGPPVRTIELTNDVPARVINTYGKRTLTQDELDLVQLTAEIADIQADIDALRTHRQTLSDANPPTVNQLSQAIRAVIKAQITQLKKLKREGP